MGFEIDATCLADPSLETARLWRETIQEHQKSLRTDLTLPLPFAHLQRSVKEQTQKSA